MITFRFGYSKLDLYVSEEYARKYSTNQLPALRRTVTIAPVFILVATELRDVVDYKYYWTEYKHTVQADYDFSAKCGCSICQATSNFYGRGRAFDAIISITSYAPDL